jgi:hypothetical protein
LRISLATGTGTVPVLSDSLLNKPRKFYQYKNNELILEPVARAAKQPTVESLREKQENLLKIRKSKVILP